MGFDWDNNLIERRWCVELSRELFLCTNEECKYYITYLPGLACSSRFTLCVRGELLEGPTVEANVWFDTVRYWVFAHTTMSTLACLVIQRSPPGGKTNRGKSGRQNRYCTITRPGFEKDFSISGGQKSGDCDRWMIGDCRSRIQGLGERIMRDGWNALKWYEDQRGSSHLTFKACLMCGFMVTLARLTPSRSCLCERSILEQKPLSAGSRSQARSPEFTHVRRLFLHGPTTHWA